MTMVLALTAEEEVKCSRDSADVSALSASGVGLVEEWEGLSWGPRGGRREERGKGARERWPPPPR